MIPALLARTSSPSKRSTVRAERDRRRDLVGARQPADRRLERDVAAALLEVVGQRRRVDVAGRQRVDPYALQDQLLGHGPREAEDPGLRGRVVRVAGAALEA